MDLKYYHIDDVARLTEVTKRTIRYYEELELLKPARTDASYRLYTEEDIDVIKEIRNLSTKLGMNSAQIKNFIGLKKSIRDILEGNVKDVHKITEVEDKIRQLMIIVDEREKVIQSIKNNCSNYLDRLDEKVTQLEEI